MDQKVILCVLDGFGHGPDYEGNAILRANASYLKHLRENYPWTLLDTSGEAVGIPAGTQGGSEVGHLTMGAGRIVFQPLLMIDKSIESGKFFQKPELLEALNYAKSNKKAFHILGMISDQGIHADIDHALALIDACENAGIEEYYVHGIADGRDVPPKSLNIFIEILQKHLQGKRGKFATLIGRFYAMDRDDNPERTQKAFDLIRHGHGLKSDNPSATVEKMYAEGLESDYYLEPILLEEKGLIKNEDVVVFFNFRTDRAQQLTEKILNEIPVKLLVFGAYTTKAPNLFPPNKVENNLGSLISKAGLKQLRVAETEKFAHVTFFFNSQNKELYEGESHILVASPKVPSYADKPEMSAYEVTNQLLPALESDYAFIALNFANLDLVGHSGSLTATLKAVETLDECLSKIVPKALENNYIVLITGDHGNAEYMLYEDGSGCPSHTRNPVPFYVISKDLIALKNVSHEKSVGGLQDIAPTILQLMQIEQPVEMTGESLV